MDIEGFLANAEYLKGLGRESRRALAEICLPKKLGRRQVLFEEGTKGLAVYFVVSGDIQLSKTAPDGREIVIKVVRDGEMFGEVVLFEQDRYPVTAAALSSSLVLVVPRHQFLCLLEDSRFRNDFIGLLMRKQRYLTEKIKYLTLHDVRERFVEFLRDRYGERKRVKPTMSKKNIAAAIGTTPESFSRLLQELRRKGLLAWERGEIEIAEGFWGGADT